MTALKTILVPVSSAAAAEAPLETAFRLGGGFDAHVTALHVRADAAAAVPLVGEGMSGAMVEEMLELAERQADERAAAARAAFEAVAARHGVPLVSTPTTRSLSAEWAEISGREEDAVARRGRLHDLLIMGHPGPQADQPSLHTLNAALLESGRPLLLAPAAVPDTIGTSAAVAWNGSAEAGRAVAFALPLLVNARHVTILSLTEDGQSSTASASELAASLAWHGIAARTVSMHAGAHAGRRLLDECGTLGADLLVMGAYTHSRLRQLIMGGVTRHVLEYARLPVFMCH